MQLCKWWIYASSALCSLRFFCSTCKIFDFKLPSPLPPVYAAPLSSSSEASSPARPFRAVEPSLCRGEVCDGCNVNSLPRLSVNGWSLAVYWNYHIFLVIWRSAVQASALKPSTVTPSLNDYGKLDFWLTIVKHRRQCRSDLVPIEQPDNDSYFWSRLLENFQNLFSTSRCIFHPQFCLSQYRGSKPFSKNAKTQIIHLVLKAWTQTPTLASLLARAVA